MTWSEAWATEISSKNRVNFFLNFFRANYFYPLDTGVNFFFAAAAPIFQYFEGKKSIPKSALILFSLFFYCTRCDRAVIQIVRTIWNGRKEWGNENKISFLPRYEDVGRRRRKKLELHRRKCVPFFFVRNSFDYGQFHSEGKKEGKIKAICERTQWMAARTRNGLIWDSHLTSKPQEIWHYNFRTG